MRFSAAKQLFNRRPLYRRFRVRHFGRNLPARISTLKVPMHDSRSADAQSTGPNGAVQEDWRPTVLVIENEEPLGISIVRSLTQATVEPAPLELPDARGDYWIDRERALPNEDSQNGCRFHAKLVLDRERALAELRDGDRFDIYFVDLILRDVDRSDRSDVKSAVKEGIELISLIRRTFRTAGIIVLSGEKANPTAVPTLVGGS